MLENPVQTPDQKLDADPHMLPSTGALSLPEDPQEKQATQGQGLLELPAPGEDLAPVAPATRSIPDTYKRATKFDFALGDKSPGVPAIVQMLNANAESSLRQQAVMQDALEEQKARSNLVANVLTDVQNHGQSLSKEGADYLYTLGRAQMKDPGTILEHLYAKRYIEQIAVSDNPENQNVFSQAMQENPNQVGVDLDAAQMMVERQEINKDIYDRAKQEYDKQGSLATGWNFLKTIIPFHSFSAFGDVGKEYGVAGSDTDKLAGVSHLFGAGASIQGTIEGLNLLPPDKYKVAATAIYEKLAKSNPYDALYFAQALQSYSSFHALVDNFQGVFDATLMPQIMKGAYKAGNLLGNKLTAAVAANTGENTIRDGLAAAGNTEAAAAATVAENLRLTGPSIGPKVEQKVHTTMPGVMDAQPYFRNIGTLSNERARRIEDILKQNQGLMAKINDGLTTVPRIDNDIALKQAFRNAEEELQKTYYFTHDAIVDVQPERTSADVFGSVDKIHAYIGRPDGTVFQKPTQAQTFATTQYRLPTGGYEIVPYKGQFAIRITKNIDETNPIVQSFRLSTDARTPETWTNAVLGWARSQLYTTSKKASTMRDVLTYAHGAGEDYLYKSLTPIRDLDGKEFSRFKRIVEVNGQEFRTYTKPDGSTVKLQGNWYDTVADYEQAYQKEFGGLPNDKEIAAYFNLRDFYNFDYHMRNTMVRLAKERRGGEQKSFAWLAQNPNDLEGKQLRMFSPWFEGRTVPKLPWESAEPFTVGYRGEDGKMRFYLSTQMYRKQRDELDKLVSSGAQVVQPFDGAQEAVSKLFNARGEPVNYIVAKDFRGKPLDTQQVEWRAGPHAMYPTEGRYTKQAIVRNTGKGRSLYAGDRVLAYHPTEAEANRFGSAFTSALRMLERGDDKIPATRQAFEAFIEKNLPFKSVEHFKNFVSANGYKTDLPIHTVASGQRVGDVADLGRLLNKNVQDLSKSAHSPDRGMPVRFTSERDRPPYSLDQVGTETNPHWKFVSTPQLDVKQQINSMATDLVRSRFYGDYLARETENWAKQFGGMLKRGPERANADPWDAIRNPDFQDGIKDMAALAAAKNSRRSILYMVGADTPSGRLMNFFREKILNEVDERLGQKAVKYIEPYMWTKGTDPLRMLRSAAFTVKLGLFYPRQLFLQAYAAVHMAAFTGNPIRASKSVLMAWASTAADLGNWHEAYLAALGKAGEKGLGLTQGQFKEFYDALVKTGMTHVGGEVGKLDTILGEKMLGRNFGQKADALNRAQSWFFRAGDRFVRRAAFAASYLEWAEANAGKKALTGDTLQSIVRRANDFTVNQTRAANTPMLQKGIPSVLTQFAGYQMRLAEQMFGATLTPMEKARILMTYAMLHGPIVGVGGVVLGALWPVYDQVRKHAIADGYNMDDPVVKFMTEGGAQMLIEKMMGSNFDFNQSFGPGGNSTIYDILGGDIFSLGGPSAKIAHEFIRRLSPFGAYLYGLFNSDVSKDAIYPLSSQDFIDATKEASALNNSARALYAWQTGRLLSANGQILTDGITGAQAWTMFASGLIPQKGYDTFLMKQISKADYQARQDVQNAAQKHVNLMLLAFRDGNTETGLLELKKARALLVPIVPPMEWGRTFQQMIRTAGSEGTYDKALYGMLKSAPQDQKGARAKEFERQIREHFGGVPHDGE